MISVTESSVTGYGISIGPNVSGNENKYRQKAIVSDKLVSLEGGDQAANRC